MAAVPHPLPPDGALGYRRQGCSQLPEGPSSRLYSATLSDLLASALAVGMEGRLVNASSADNGDGGGGGLVGVGPGTLGDQRAQVSTLRLGGNRFGLDSWACLLRGLATRPPRVLDLSWSSISAATSPERVPTAAAAPTFPPPSTLGNLSPVAGFPASQGYLGHTGTEAEEDVSLCELIAATVLPADAPGVEVLNLTGSEVLQVHPRTEPVPDGRGTDSRAESSFSPDGGRGSSDILGDSFGEPTAVSAVASLFRDALMSPLCRTTHLVFPAGRTVTTGEPRGEGRLPRGAGSPGTTPERTGQSSFAGSYAATTVARRPSSEPLGPRDVRGFCEAASACSSLRVLDLTGSDLSGAVGASAAAASVACLLRPEAYGIPDSGAHGGFDQGGSALVGGGEMSSAAPALTRLSLRGCRLGARGLSAVLGAIAGVIGERDDGYARGSADSRGDLNRPPRFPCVLDLSDNRPGAGCVSIPPRGADGDGDRVGEEAEVAEIVGWLRVIRERGFIWTTETGVGTSGNDPRGG